MTTMTRTGKILAAVAAVTLLAAACSGGDDEGGGAPAAITTTTISPAAAADVSAATTVTNNLSAMRAAYDFDTRVETNGSPVTQVTGRNVNGNSQFKTTTDGGTEIDIISVGGVIWASTDAGATWAQQTQQDISSDPLGPLLEPGAITVNGDQITATYPGVNLGLADPSIDVALRADGTAVELVYATDTATVRTRLSPAADATAVVAPA